MIIKYLGTAAAEGIPSVFCNCITCQEARKKKGRFIRTRSQAILDNRLLVDFNADTYMHSLLHDINLSKIGNAVITHVHEDHYYPTELLNRRIGFCNTMEYETFTLHGSQDIQDHASKIFSAYIPENPSVLQQEKRIAFNCIKPYETQTIDGFKVTALPATHGTAHPYIYIFEKDGKTLLYFNDSGYLTEETMAFLKEKKVKFDLVSYDCTWGKNDAGNSVVSHMGVPNNVEARRRFIENGNYNDSTIDVITHFSHNIPNVGYDDMLKVANDNNFVLAYDGLEIEF